MLRCLQKILGFCVLASLQVGCDRGPGARNPRDPKLEAQRQNMNHMVSQAQDALDKVVSKAEGAFEDAKRAANDAQIEFGEKVSQANRAAEGVADGARKISDLGHSAKAQGKQAVEAVQTAVSGVLARPNPTPQ